MSGHRRIDPQDFCDQRHSADMTRKQVADLLDVTVRTIQNWETGGARIPWMAYRMLRILKGYALPGKVWEGWTMHGDRIYSPNGRWFDANSLAHLEQVFGMARLWRMEYVKKHHKPVARVLVFPDRSPMFTDNKKSQQTRLQRKGGTR